MLKVTCGHDQTVCVFHGLGTCLKKIKGILESNFSVVKVIRVLA